MEEEKPPNPKFPRNVVLIWIYSFFSGIVFFQPIFSYYLLSKLANPLEVSLLFTIEAVTVVILELPSGAIADIFGKKRALISASILRFCAVILLMIGRSFSVFVIFALINAISQSLSSGTVEALLYDSIHLPNSDIRAFTAPISYKTATAINGVMWPLSASISGLIGGFLSKISFQITIWLTLFPVGVGIFIVFLLKSIPVEITAKPESVKIKGILNHMKNSLSKVKHEKTLQILFLSGFLAFAFAEVMFQFKPVYFEHITLPLEFYGLMYMFSLILSFLGSLFAPLLAKMVDDKNLLIFAQTMIGVFIIAATFIPNPFLNSLILSFESFFWGMRFPIQNDWTNQLIDSSERATLNSLTNMANQLGFAAVSPLIGYLMGFWQMKYIYQFLGLAQVISVLILAALPRRNKIKRGIESSK